MRKRYAEVMRTGANVGVVNSVAEHNIYPEYAPESRLLAIEIPTQSTPPEPGDAWEGGSTFSTGVGILAKPEVSIITYLTSVATPIEEANTIQAVNFKVTIPGVGDDRIVIPIDRLNAQNEVQESGAQWLALQFASDVATGSVTFDKSGRYGVGPWTSQKRFDVPLKHVTVLA